MTTEEIRDLAAQVKELIAAQAKDLSQYEEVTDISQVTTLPGLKGTGTAATLVRVAMTVLKGADGKTPELRADGTNLLWRKEGDTSWQTLCSLEALRGAKVQLRKGDTGIEWKYDNTTEWMTLIPVDELAFKYNDLTPQQKQELTRKPVLSAVDASKGDEPQGQFTADGEDSAGNPKYRLQLTLPKGDKGDAFTYDDFTPEQIEQLQKPATDIAASVAASEELRVKSEELRKSAEAARAESEELRVKNEESRGTAETARAEAEASRASAEQGRVSAESARAAAEQGRVDAEAKRVAAESARATEEGKRAGAEETRVESEESRNTAEEARNTAEELRNTAETARSSAESARAAAETERMHEETLRAQSEAARAGAEELRVKSEELRVENEESRKSAEQGRAEAEASRVTAETARAEAETRRNEELGRLTAECEAATEGVDEAKAEALAAAETARNLPKIEGGTWRVYDSESGQYLDSGVGATGRSPKIEGGTWWTWDDAAGDYQDTGVSVSSQYVLTKEAVEQVLTGDIASHSHDAQMAEKLAPYAKTADVDEKIAAAAPTKEKIEAALTGDITSHNHTTQMTQALQPYAKTEDVDSKVGQLADNVEQLEDSVSQQMADRPTNAQLAETLKAYVTATALEAALAAYELTKQKIEAALTGDITSHNHSTQLSQALQPYATTADVNTKVAAAEAKIPTKLSQLQNDNSTVQDAAYVHTDQNFTAALKQKLDGLANYDDSALRSLVSAAQAKADQAQQNLDKLVSGDASTAIDTFNEIEAFLKGVTDTETLTGLLAEQKSELQSDAASKYQPKGSYAAASHNHDGSYVKKTGDTMTGNLTFSQDASHNHDGSYVKKTGDTMTGNLTFSQDSELSWSRNTDYFTMKFKNTADNDADSYALFKIGDNGNEYFKWQQVNGSSTTDLMTLKGDALRFKENVVLHAGNYNNYAPTKTGSGASGTWPIAISGNASTATKSSDSDKLGGKAATEYALKSEVGSAGVVCVTTDSAPTQDTLTYTDDKGTHQFKVGDMVKWVVITGYTGLPDGWFDQDFGSMGTPPSVRIGNEEFSWDGKPMAIYVDSDMTSGRTNYRVDCPSTNYGSDYYAAYGESFNISGKVRYVTLEFSGY